MADSIFELAEFKPLQGRWQRRSQELARRQSYYDGSVYSKHRRMFSSDLRAALDPLYRGTKPLYLPLARAVDVDVGIVPGGWGWPSDNDLPDGVSQGQLDAWKLARRRLFDMSDWIRRGVLYVHYGAVFGVSGLRVADLRERGQVQLCPCSPLNFLLVETGQYDAQTTMALWIEKREGDDGPVEYAEVIEADRIRTFVGGAPMGIDGRNPEYQNELGVVPFVEVRHMETGQELGESTFQKTIPMLDEVNELASYLADVIRKHTDPQWVAKGVEPSELIRGDNVWFFPADGGAEPVAPRIDVAAVLSFVQEIKGNVEGSLPELAFQDLKQKDQIATATLELQLMELVLKIQRIRPNYDQGLVDAMRMAGAAARTMSLADIAALDDSALMLNYDRPVLPANRLDEIEVEAAELALEMQRDLAAGEGMTRMVNAIAA